MAYREFLDEVLDGTPKYNVNNNVDGTKDITLSNDVIQEGTPLNRATFANLQGDLYTTSQYNTPTYSGNAMTLNLPLTSYEVGKIINIKSPATFNTYPTININQLGAKAINSTLIQNNTYTLVYNGNSFDVINNVILGTYTGNNESTRNINLGFKPSHLMVWGTANSVTQKYPIYCELNADNIFNGWNSSSSNSPCYFSSSYSKISIIDTGFEIFDGANSANKSNGLITGFNATDATYHYRAVR